MPSIRYLNQSAPFWDFVASLENHPMNPLTGNQPARQTNNEEGPSDSDAPPPAGPWAWGPPHSWGPPPPWAGNPGWHRGGMPHHPHGRHGRHGRRPPPGNPDDGNNPPPPGGDEPAPPPEYEDSPDTLMAGDEKRRDAGPAGPATGPEDNDCSSATENEGKQRSHSKRRGGGHHCKKHRNKSREPEGARGHGHHGRDHGHGFGGRDFGGRRGRHGRGDHHGRENPWGGFPVPGPAGRWLEFLTGQIPGLNGSNGAADRSGAQSGFFTPEADVFDTPAAFVLHLSLPGAKKEDVAVSWDQEASELTVGGVLYRPGDEEFLGTLAMEGRKVGAFEKKVRLGSRASPANVDVEGISARLEDGVLVVEVPKLEGGFVEVRRVDVE